MNFSKNEIQLLQSAIMCALTDENIDYVQEDKLYSLDEKLEKLKKLVS